MHNCASTPPTPPYCKNSVIMVLQQFRSQFIFTSANEQREAFDYRTGLSVHRKLLTDSNPLADPEVVARGGELRRRKGGGVPQKIFEY